MRPVRWCVGLLLLLPYAVVQPGAAVRNDTMCKNRYVDECRPKLRGYKGIPSSEEEVNEACKSFKAGMRCMDEFSEQCLTEKNRAIMEQTVAGAKHTFKFLCDDPVFKQEYLQYSGCYNVMTDDWDSCHRKFEELVQEEMDRKNVSTSHRAVELCCAKQGFLLCVYRAARMRCGKNEAVFLRRIADTLTSTHVHAANCPQVTVEFCAGAAPTSAPLAFVGALAASLMVRP